MHQDQGPLLTEEEYKLLANYWARRTDFDLATRERLLNTILKPLRERLDFGPPSDGPGVLMLEDRIKSLLDKGAIQI